MKKQLKHYLIVNLSYKLTKQLLDEKIYSQVINSVINDMIVETENFYETHKEYLLTHLVKRELELIIEADEMCMLLRNMNWENTPEGFEFWFNLFKKYTE